jgi:hypothetical protein
MLQSFDIFYCPRKEQPKYGWSLYRKGPKVLYIGTEGLISSLDNIKRLLLKTVTVLYLFEI